MAGASDFLVRLRMSLAMTSWVRTTLGLVLLFFTVQVVPAASVHTFPCSYPSFGADTFGQGVGAACPSQHWVLCQKWLAVTVSGASLSCQGRLAPPARFQLASFSQLELLSSTVLACASCLALPQHTWGKLPDKEQGRGLLERACPRGTHFDGRNISRGSQSGVAEAALPDAGHWLLTEVFLGQR